MLSTTLFGIRFKKLNDVYDKGQKDADAGTEWEYRIYLWGGRGWLILPPKIPYILNEIGVIFIYSTDCERFNHSLAWKCHSKQSNCAVLLGLIGKLGWISADWFLLQSFTSPPISPILQNTTYQQLSGNHDQYESEFRIGNLGIYGVNLMAYFLKWQILGRIKLRPRDVL